MSEHHSSRITMATVTSVGMLVTAAVTDHIQSPKLRMACMAGVAAAIAVGRELLYHGQQKPHAPESHFADRAKHSPRSGGRVSR